jgi:DNA (cytosine-5)-methyltransferase 1
MVRSGLAAGPVPGEDPAAPTLTCLEICAGAGGAALGLEQAGFSHAAVIDADPDSCGTLRLNRGSSWTVIQGDVRDVDGRSFRGIDLFSGGVPCPPFTVAGKQLGAADERDLFRVALRLIEQSDPRAVLLENVRGLAEDRFSAYRAQILAWLHRLGYRTWWDVVYASEHGVPQLRPRFVLVALKEPWASGFRWPKPAAEPPLTVGQALHDLMSARGWPGADDWRDRANDIAPTIVGGSKQHGGPDLGPTWARKAWASLGVDGRGVADEPPGPDFPLHQPPRLTTKMVARIQGFPPSWQFAGRKTAAYRQVGNAFPPPVARALGLSVRRALDAAGPACRAGRTPPGPGSALADPGNPGETATPAGRPG